MVRKTLRPAAGATLLAVLALTACVPPVPQPTPAPAPPPAPAPATPAPAPPPPPAPTNWIDAPQTVGDWRYAPLAAGGRASFVDPAGTVLFEMVCAAGRQVTLARTGGPGVAAMVVRTETAERSLPVTGSNGAAVAALDPRDSLLDAMAFSKGRFAIQVTGSGALYLPAWPEVSRVVEDCR